MSEEIKALDDRGKARDKVSVWLGSNTHQAVIHTVIEATSNSCDLIANNNGNDITWTLFNEKEIQIEDNCSGLPVEGYTNIETIDINGNKKIIKKPNYILLLATMFAGTKYDSLETGESTTGTNGLFLSVLSFCSDYVEYTIGRPDGNIYYCLFENGYLKQELKIIGKTNNTFTRIKYKLSDEVFTENYFTYEELCEIAKKQSSLINGNIIIIDKENNKQETFQYKNGIVDYLNELTDENDNIINNIIINNTAQQEIEIKGNKKIDKININLVMNYNKNEENTINIEFLNRSHLIYHGTIYDGFIEGLRKTFNKYIKDNGKYNKNEKAITKDDILCGLNYIINFTSLHPIMYQNQTKFSTDIQYFKDIMIDTILKYFEIFSIESKQIMDNICNKVLINKRSREKAETNRKEIKRKAEQEMNVINRPEKFVPCRSKDRTKKELILIEGDSSLNSVKLSRDSEFQCIYPLKGKPINALKKSIDKLMNNQEIKDIFTILNCGMLYNNKPIKGEKVFNINDLDIDKIVIFTDEDDDGMHIRSLIICIFSILAPEIITQGHLYILDSPLYRIDSKNKIYLAYSDKEKNDIIRQLNKNNNTFIESRFKGLGGLSVNLLSDTAMNVEKRKLTQITRNDITKAKEVLEMFLDDDSTDRKEYIELNGEQYFDYSIYEI